MSRWGFDFLTRFEVKDDALVVRRYMAHWKFEDLIKSKVLHFAPASDVSDKFEGHRVRSDDGDVHRRMVHDRSKHRPGMICVECHNQKATVICCWTKACNQTNKMWLEYGDGPRGVMIETSVGALRRALGVDFLIIPVQYYEFPGEPIPRDHSLQPFFYKQKGKFSWEDEIRIIGNPVPGMRIESPCRVPMDVQPVLHKIVPSPFAPPSYRKDIQSLLNDASLSIPIHDSSLAKTFTP